MKPLSLAGANSVVFKCASLSVTRDFASGEQVVEEGGEPLVLKGLVTPWTLPPGETSSRVHESMLKHQAADYEVLIGMPPHANIIEVVHHFEAPALLLRPFVGPPLLPYLSLSKTT